MATRLIGWSFIAIGIALAVPGILEIGSGAFTPTGYSRRSWWMPAAVESTLGAFAPYFTVAVWFILVATLLWLGSRMLRKPTKGAIRWDSGPL